MKPEIAIVEPAHDIAKHAAAVDAALRLVEHRLHGEWFADAPEVMAAIAEALQ